MANWAPYSCSKLSTYKQCPRKFQYQYILKPFPFKSSLALERGEYAHLLIEHILRDKLKSLKIPPYTFFNDVNEVHSMVLQSKDYLKSLKESTDSKYIEYWFNLDEEMNPTNNKKEKLLTGKIDYYSINGKVGRNIDWKTGGKSIENVNTYKTDQDQLDLYGLWMIQRYDLDEVFSEFYYIDLQYKVEKKILREDIPAIKRKFYKQIDTIETDKTFALKDGPLCAYCDYKTLCFE